MWLPAASIAWFAPGAQAVDTITWTCQADTSWQMQQPFADYEAGMFPSWVDCEAWRDGDPGSDYVWSYGASVATTTTVVETTTSSSTSTTVEQTTTTIADTTTTSEQTTTTATTSTTTTTVASPPPATAAPAPPPQTTTTSTEPPETTAVTTTTVEETTTQVATTETTTTTVASTTTTTVASTTTSSVAPTTTVAVVDRVITEQPQEQPVVQNAPVQLDAVLQDLSQDDLSEGQISEIISAIQDAPEEVRKSFEEFVNVFDGRFDDYVPTGSTISIAERRALVAATSVIFVLPTPIPTRKK